MDPTPTFNYLFVSDTYSSAVELAKSYFSFEIEDEKASVSLPDCTIDLYFLSPENPYPRAPCREIIDCMVLLTPENNQKQEDLFDFVQSIKWYCRAVVIGLDYDMPPESGMFTFPRDQLKAEKTVKLVLETIPADLIKFEEGFKNADPEGKRQISSSEADSLFQELGKDFDKLEIGPNLRYFHVKLIYFCQERDGCGPAYKPADSFGSSTFKELPQYLAMKFESSTQEASTSTIQIGHKDPISPKISLKGKILAGEAYEKANLISKSDSFVFGIKLGLNDDFAVSEARRLVKQTEELFKNNEEYLILKELGMSIGIYVLDGNLHVELKFCQILGEIMESYSNILASLKEILVEDEFDFSTEIAFNDLFEADLKDILKKLLKYNIDFKGNNKHLSAILGLISRFCLEFDCLEDEKKKMKLDFVSNIVKIVDCLNTFELNMKFDCDSIGDNAIKSIPEEISAMFEESREGIFAVIDQNKEDFKEIFNVEEKLVSALNYDRISFYANSSSFKANIEFELNLPGLTETLKKVLFA